MSVRPFVGDLLLEMFTLKFGAKDDSNLSDECLCVRGILCIIPWMQSVGF